MSSIVRGACRASGLLGDTFARLWMDVPSLDLLSSLGMLYHVGERGRMVATVSALRACPGRMVLTVGTGSGVGSDDVRAGRFARFDLLLDVLTH